jgi:hypothetical protein
MQYIAGVNFPGLKRPGREGGNYLQRGSEVKTGLIFTLTSTKRNHEAHTASCKNSFCCSSNASLAAVAQGKL